MSTRSLICVEVKGVVRACYCHWDGYIENNGVILLDNYKTQKDVEKLVNLGSISSLRATFEETVKEQHSDYHEVSEYHSLMDFLMSAFKGSDCEYFYLWINGEWLVFSGHFPQIENEDYIAQGFSLDKLLNL